MEDSEEDDNIIIIPIDQSFSDGDQERWPTEERWALSDDRSWRILLAKQWLEEIGAYEQGAVYSLDRLPEGYALLDRPRKTNPDMGRPPGKPNNNTNKSLMRPVGRPPGRPVGRPVKKSILDKEGTPDVYKMAIMKLRATGRLDQEITEPESIDWRAEKTRLEEYLEKLNMQPSYIPRAGEIVLWVPLLDGELVWNPESKRPQIYSPDEDRWLGDPKWRAGVIGQASDKEDTILQDLVETSSKDWQVNYSGFRVETFPDPHSSDKSYSLHSKYVPLKCIKPFNAFELFLQGTPREKLHPSIEYALTVMSSFSLLDRYHIKGTWPDARIYCRGIFLGAELLVVGDAVRLKPDRYKADSSRLANVTDVMIIDEIQLQLVQCVDDAKSEQLAENYRVRLKGKVYTTNSLRAYMKGDKMQPLHALTHDEVVSAFQQVGMSGYGEWYSVYSGKTVVISQDMIIGRCYEPDAMQLLFGSLSLGNELPGVIIGREYSRKTDERIPEGKHWFWGDYRTQTLAIDSLNGEDVGQYSEARNLKMWRANLKVMDGIATPAELRDARIPGDIGRPVVKSKSTFAEVRKTSKLVATGLGGDASNVVSSADEGSARPADEDSESEDFSTPVYVRGGTVETEEGDYVPDSERESKRTKFG
ncbi:hypothetical protein MW887_010237 [Aspergillus wentii]|nr:hypothetical protein MW887_010237 [Aspergillus wentii]